MSVNKEVPGRRSVQVEVEVPGTPEEVWQAIATGPGVSSWFVPCEIEEREGGNVVSHFGPGFDATATITAWDPPHRFAAESLDFGPNAPPMATEWVVEAKSGGVCIVRVVHNLFADTDDWDNELTGVESGWPAFFRILKLYLTHYRAQSCSQFQSSGFASGPEAAAWESLTRSLGLSGAEVGQHRTTDNAAPPLAGVVEALNSGSHPYQLLLLDAPSPGAAFVSACPMGDQVYITLGFYLYGDHAAEAASHNRPLWDEWLQRHLAPAGAPEITA